MGLNENKRGLNRQKALILLFSGIIIVSLLVLGAGLSSLEFKPGSSFNLKGSGKEASTEGSWPDTEVPPWLKMAWQAFFALASLLFILLLILAIFFPEWRRELLAALIIIAIFSLLLPFKSHILPGIGSPKTAPEAAPLEAGEGEGIEIGPVSAPNWSSFIFIAIALAVLAFLVWRFAPMFLKLKSKEATLPSLANLAGEAAQAIRAGRSLENVVLRCYKDMSELLSKSKRIKYERAMTAREFEQRLSEVGVKDEHASRLTRLFERVRYGGRRPSKAQEHEAIECLEAIAQEYGDGDRGSEPS